MCHSSLEARIESRCAAWPHPEGQLILQGSVDNSRDISFCALAVPLHQFVFFPSGLPASGQDQCLADRMAQGSCFKRLIMLLPAKNIEMKPVIKGFFIYLLPQ